MQYFRSLLFTTALFVSTLVYALVVLICCWMPHRYLYRIAQSWAYLQLWMVRQICGLHFSVEGSANIPKGNHVSMWKHSSAWETIAQMIIFPPQAWVLKRELTWIPLIGWAMQVLKPIAINRKASTSAVNQVLTQGQQRLSQGLWILIFPEGTRMPHGQTRRYGVSGALLASRAGCKIVPVAHNSGRFWARRGLLKKQGIIRVVIGPPIDTAGRSPRELNEIAQHWIEDTVKQLDRDIDASSD
jgi:1-acyl-sn-glycerol-3-phosphate acyltransferase